MSGGFRSTLCRSLAVAALAMLVSCTAGSGGSPSPPSASGSSTTSGSASTATASVDETTEPDLTRVTRTLNAVSDHPPDDWTLVTELGYGIGDAQLGLADDHGGQTTPWGPEYAAPDGDGNWWVLDTNKRRVARFTHHGRFLGSVAIPGRHAEFQLPFVVGTTLWASGGRGEALLADATSARRVDVAGSWPYSDGTRLYNDTTGNPRALDPSGPLLPEDVDALLTPRGTRFRAQLAEDDNTNIEVTLPDLGRKVTVDLVTDSGELPEVVGFGVQADISDRLLFLVWAVADGEQLAGFFTLDASSGSVSDSEPMRNPFSDSDPGSPAHLRVIPGATSAAIAVVDTDALRIYRRDWPERPFTGG